MRWTWVDCDYQGEGCANGVIANNKLCPACRGFGAIPYKMTDAIDALVFEDREQFATKQAAQKWIEATE
jgi:hypothetical protein